MFKKYDHPDIPSPFETVVIAILGTVCSLLGGWNVYRSTYRLNIAKDNWDPKKGVIVGFSKHKISQLVPRFCTIPFMPCSPYLLGMKTAHTC